MDEVKSIGAIFSVSTGKFEGVLNNEIVIDSGNEQEQYRVGQVGSYVLIPEAGRMIIGTIISMYDSGLGSPARDFSGKRFLVIQPLGTLKNGKFERGVTALPTIGSPIYPTTGKDLEAVFSTYRAFNFSLGPLSLFDKEKLYIDPNKFFGKHIAVFGSTGSGKSYTVSTIIQKVSSLDNSHVMILDLHGEYAHAFPDQNVIKITELELPYWLMNFEELVETFID
jgi:hypothetical protein